MERFVSLIGIFAILSLAVALSKNRQKINWRMVTIGLALQLSFALLVLGIPSLGISGPLRFVFDAATSAVNHFLDYTKQGSLFVFGDLANSDKLGFIFAFQVLPTIIFMGALTSVLYQLGLMQIVVRSIARVMQKLMGVSGAESLSVAADIFVGQTESPLVIKPYIKNMTESELFSLMVGGMATVAGGVLAAYVGMLVSRIPDIAGHLLTASVLAAPASLVIAKIMIPETDTPETLGKIPKETEEKAHSNVIEAAAAGAGEGLTLAFNVGAMLLAFIALIALGNGILGWLGELIHFSQWGHFLVPKLVATDPLAQSAAIVPRLNLELILGWIFAPLAFLTGVPWQESLVAGSLIGQKVVLNEFVAYLQLSQIMSQLSDRAVIILSYALCGFANFSSIAIQIGGTGGLAPSRKKDIARLGLRAVIAGSLTSLLTGAVAGLII